MVLACLQAKSYFLAMLKGRAKSKAMQSCASDEVPCVENKAKPKLLLLMIQALLVIGEVSYD